MTALAKRDHAVGHNALPRHLLIRQDVFKSQVLGSTNGLEQLAQLNAGLAVED